MMATTQSYYSELQHKLIRLINESEGGKSWSIKGRDEFIPAITGLINNHYPIEFSSDMQKFRKFPDNYKKMCYLCKRISHDNVTRDNNLICIYCATLPPIEDIRTSTKHEDSALSTKDN